MSPADVQHEVARACWDALDVHVAYAVLRLRSDVFVVEQQCVYPDLDGRDTDAGTEHRWAHEPGEPAAVLAYLRVLPDPAGVRVGRVVTAPAARGRGLAGVLVQQVLTDHGASVAVVLDAQSHLAGWYARYGFVRDGDDFVEDGIPHTPMARPAG